MMNFYFHHYEGGKQTAHSVISYNHVSITKISFATNLLSSINFKAPVIFIARWKLLQLSGSYQISVMLKFLFT